MEDELDFMDTKLHEAVRYSDIDDVRLALKEGYSPDQIGTYQWSALHEATSNGDIDIVRLLLKYGANPNQCDRLKGSTAVHYAASNGYNDILQLLLDKGGQYSVVNKDGLNALDVAVGTECQKLLREQRNDDTTFTTPKEVILDNLKQDLQLYANNNRNNHAAGHADDASSILSIDPDDISIATSTSSSSSRPHSRAWGPEKLLGIRKEQTLGTIQLSFEYNSKRKTFKIRVWKVCDLLMPPADSSQISGIYVKSFLQPDEKKRTRQKTEEVKVVTPPPDPNAPQTDSMAGNFTPASFSFKRPLEYEEVTCQMVAEKIIDLEVCITQRFSRKSYVISYLSIPMHVACRRLVKEKFPLQPRIGAKIPENMKVYSATDLDYSVSLRPKKVSVSNPSLYRCNSRTSWAVPYVERASSESNLQVLVEKTRKQSSIEITVPNEEDEDLENALNDIAIMERNETLQQRESSIEMQDFSRMPGVANLAGEDGRTIEVTDPVNVAEVLVHLPQESTFTTRTKFPRSKDSDVVSIQSSRPETPSWDYYEETPTFSLIPIEAEEELPPLPDSSQAGYDPMTPVLPVASNLQLATKNQTRERKPEVSIDNIDENSDNIEENRRETEQKHHRDDDSSLTLQRKSRKGPQSKAAVPKDVRAKYNPQETLEMSTFSEMSKNKVTEDVESCIAEVHAVKPPKKRQFLKERIAKKDRETSSTETNSPIQEAVSKLQSQMDEECSIGGDIELEERRPNKDKQQRYDEESSIGDTVASSKDRKVEVSCTKESESLEKLDLPVLHRKKRGRPKPKPQ